MPVCVRWYECCGQKQSKGVGNASDQTTISYKVVKESFSPLTFELRFEEGEEASIEGFGEREF